MELKFCKECGAKNRIERFRVGAQAKCGRCGTALAEPRWISVARLARRYAIPIGVLCSIGFYYVYDEVRAPTRVRSNYAPPSSANTASLPVVSQSEKKKQMEPQKQREQCAAVPIVQGIHARYTKAKALAPFRVETKEGGNYFIVLINDVTDATVLTAYTSGGSPLEFNVPFGLYRVNYAFGASPWCGETRLFGDDTDVVSLDRKLVFEATKTQYQGHVISLVRRVDGNLTTTSISPQRLFGNSDSLHPAK